LVARNEPQIVERTTPRPKKYKPKPLHLATWVHVLAFFFIILLGWIDMVPNTKEVVLVIRFMFFLFKYLIVKKTDFQF
jgi:hypothetical protein